MANTDILGKKVDIVIDRPIGSMHPEHGTIYPVNYGYTKAYIGGDGAYQDVYLLGVDEPIMEYTAVVIAVIVRKNDVETKWVAAPEGMHFF